MANENFPQSPTGQPVIGVLNSSGETRPVGPSNPVPIGGTASEAHIGEVGGITPRVTASFSRPADNVAYTAGDLIGNSLTAASVVPITFAAARISGGSARLTGCRCVVTPASGNLVIANLAFDLLLFRPATDIPFATAGYPADNAALAVSSLAMKQLVGVFSFSASGWRSPAGSTSVAGVAGWQAVPLNSGRPFAPFNLSDLASLNLLGILQAQAAWTPTGIVNEFAFALDVEQN